MASASLEGRLLNVQRMSTEDGPGIRTTVFLKGCSLSCTWCHNPESISVAPRIVWNDWKCVGARACVKVCPEGAITLGQHGVELRPPRCNLCLACVEQCPSTALELLGKPWGVGELFAEVDKDRSYFAASGGGVTVSGGEPALQAPFVDAFLGRCHGSGLHTAVDTCGLCSITALAAITRHADLVLYDLKEIDAGRHARFTGQSNQRVLANLIELGSWIRRGGTAARLWIRTPLIPGTTAREDNVAGIGRFIKKHLDGLVARWELCSFNNLAGNKYRRLGIPWSFETVDRLREQDLRRFREIACCSGVDPAVVIASGPTRLEPGAHEWSVSCTEQP